MYKRPLFSLAGNAVKFTETGGVRISVERVGGSAARPRLAFLVDDTGPGVAPEARTRIFEEFGHADSSDAVRQDGAGLGLAVVRKLAAAMDGSVKVESRPDGAATGGGARFRFEAAFAAVAVARDKPLRGQTVAVRAVDPFVLSAARAQIEASGGVVANDAPVTLVDHADAPAGALAALPSSGRGIVLLKPAERDLIARYRAVGFHGYLIKPLRRASLAERVLAAVGAEAPDKTCLLYTSPSPRD